MLDTLRKSIRDQVESSRSPVLLWSSGKESMLLYWLLREITDVPLIFWRSGLTKEQREFAKGFMLEFNPTVFNYPPMDSYLVSQGEGLALVNEYPIGRHPFPVIFDIEHSDKCILDSEPMRLQEMRYTFDLTFIGTKKTDSHYVTGSNPIPEDFEFGDTRFAAPLRNLTDSDVWTLIMELGVPYDEKRYLGDEGRDPSIKHFCTRCLQGKGEVFCPKETKMIPSVEWDKQTSLDAFRERFGFQKVGAFDAGKHPQ